MKTLIVRIKEEQKQFLDNEAYKKRISIASVVREILEKTIKRSKKK